MGRTLGRLYHRYWTATTISEFGDSLTAVALPIVAFSLTRSALIVGAVVATQQGTSLLFGVAAGVITDRGSRGRIMVVADIGCVLATLALALSTWRDGLSVGLLIFVAGMIGTLSVLHESADAAALPILVGQTELLRASGQLQAGLFAALAVGPVVAGLLITAAGVSLAFAIDAATYATAALLLASVGPMFVLRSRQPARLSRLWAEARAGFHALGGDRLMIRALLLANACNLLVVTVEGQLVPYAQRDLHVGPLGIGLYTALAAVSALAATWTAARSRAVSGTTMVAATVPAAVCVLLAGLWPTLGTTALAMISVGACSGTLNAHFRAARQRRFDLDLQGRVAMSARVTLYGPQIVALTAGGALADRFGSPALFVILAALAGLLIAAAVFGGVNQLREEMTSPATQSGK
jgi:MFS family permease